ncbi:MULTISPECIES: SWIM zinc finger family protein [Cyanophyceae]|uniref:SWIM zinc finger family protein n=1 Tax=Cyanophyceae TaxID=3028117 RepID=UPI001688732A|nr:MULTISPECIES: SWIM zinc finger family protein [Cyanophyceae]MBD1915835.1 SWIM zinc finger family protein [Phormidium sp. FACHB-77]MBD2030491.1 SWIM zinc finger family protein [Phormidium sp. FACHB-322]MBD2053493.1 SWIM zinc finger family protein [Leptolyngbya sp. FACHB-60]
MTAYASASSSAYALEDEAWWVQRWVELLNTYRFKKRLERGRIYAREGHILSLEYKGSKVTALVQGTAEEPYKLSIWLDAFSDEDWNYVIDSLSEQAIYSAQLLAGEMPAEIEAVFTANGLSLYPFNLSEVHSKCSCPDPKNPCKHIAAVYYQLGDFFREDPFVLFQLRGRSRDSILDALRQRRQSTATSTEILTTDTELGTQPESGKATSQIELNHFWAYTDPLDSELVVITPAETTVLDVLGKIPLPPEDAPAVMGYLKEIYQTVAQQAMMQALG